MAKQRNKLTIDLVVNNYYLKFYDIFYFLVLIKHYIYNLFHTILRESSLYILQFLMIICYEILKVDFYLFINLFISPTIIDIIYKIFIVVILL